MDEPKKIRIPKNLQIKMIEFFLKTSIPKSIEQKALLSTNERKKE